MNDTQNNASKTFFMIHATKQIPITMLMTETEADTIFSKKYTHGYLYLLKFDHKNQKRLSYVEKRIKTLDDLLKQLNKTTATMFVSIADSNSSDGKVLGFNSQSRASHYLFREIVNTAPTRNGSFQLQQGVNTYTRKQIHSDQESFDVVKKRKAMDAAPPSDEPDSPAALTAFEEFERSVLPALERIQASDAKDRQRELLHLEDRIAKGLHISPTGGVYFAWSDCLNCMKIGATRRETATPRLRELSRHVTSPFKLAAWLPTPTPFRLEMQAHAFFGDKRIREAGAGTEFFHIGGGEASAYVTRMQEEAMV
jgi:hypothetical protein